MKRSKRGKHLQWKEVSMAAAIEAITQNSMSQRLACKTFNIPRCTLQLRLNGKTAVGARPGHPTVLSHDEEEKLIDYACNKASMGAGFGRTQFRRYAADLARKYKKAFKKGVPSLHWWRLIKKRHSRMTLRQPEGTASVSHQCMDPVKVGKYFAVVQEMLSNSGLTNSPHCI